MPDQLTEGNRFYYGTVHDEPEIAAPSDLAEGEEPPEQINLKLTALIKGRNLRVIVDGNVKQVGDEVDPGWTLTEIDPDAEAVILCGPDGQTILLRGDVESLSSVGAVMAPKGVTTYQHRIACLNSSKSSCSPTGRGDILVSRSWASAPPTKAGRSSVVYPIAERPLGIPNCCIR